MSKVASAFLHLTGTNTQEGLSGPPSLPPSLCGGLHALLVCLGLQPPVIVQKKYTSGGPETPSSPNP